MSEAGFAGAPDTLLQFWGKARAPEDSPVTWHPIAYHLLDVAAAARAILEARPIALRRAAQLLGITDDEALRLLTALVALHDLGKYAPAFQAKSAEHWPAALSGTGPERWAPSHHTADGYALWEQLLSPQLADRVWMGGRSVLDLLSIGVFGHHGRPVRSADGRRPLRGIFPDASREAALGCADAMLELLLPEPVQATPPSLRQARIASWWVSGLITIADWIGSNERWFEYRRPDLSLADYWEHAMACARRAVIETGIATPQVAPARSFVELTGRESPTPAQRWASEVKLPDGPVLVILEDVTGAGKTEAAQMLVHRLMVDGRAAGAYWGMPTMATANAMYERQASAVAALFEDVPGGPRPSVVLAHGQARMSERFQSTVLRHPDARLEAAASDGPGLAAAAACSAFLADNRRAALLADVGAGTVDQAILGALPSRFNTVRLFGMADRVLVFDEAHAYDAYMGVEIQQLLRFQAALGGCAVVLSATLTMDQREAFVTAWREGVAGGERRSQSLFADAEPAMVQSAGYPLATIVAAGDGLVREERVEAAEWSRREVAVRFVRSVDDALTHVLRSAEGGAAVAWIRNSVQDCLDAAAAVRAAGCEPMIFHARFAQCDRQAREQRVLELFGERGAAAERRGAILIATQVVEQSLDLDFDVLVSDLAPVDLLIQRAGRLQRHGARDAERPRDLGCELVVLAPPTDAEPDGEWLGRLLPRTARVYQNLGVLWRSAKVLESVGRIATPDGLRELVEAAYNEDEVPDALLQATQAAEGKEFGDAATAHHATLKPAQGYHGDAESWADDMRVPTRLGDEQTTVRLARPGPDGSLAPWATMDGPRWMAWSLSEVKLASWKVPFGSAPAPEYAPAVDAARAEWGRFEQEITVLPLVESGPGAWTGELTRPDGKGAVRVSYSVARGVQYE